MLTFSILGAIEIRQNDHVIRLGGTMQQTLLATLLVSGGTLVTVDSLMEELWGTTPPAKVENALQAQISRLRRSLSRLEPDRPESRLTTSISGYLFTVDRTELDAWAFLHTLNMIRARMETGTVADVHREIADLRKALDLWRGPVYGGLVGGPLCQTAAGKYRESRNAALALLYELELNGGGHAKVLPELTELFAQNPLQEQFCMLLLVALYRSGRQIDALNTYRQFRHRLAENLGIEPSPALRQYERAILTHDPVLMRDELPRTARLRESVSKTSRPVPVYAQGRPHTGTRARSMAPPTVAVLPIELRVSREGRVPRPLG
ncbi:AfsR/SARP family transcriptional regulator [Sphaerisporangium sp. TRM90804]|uniref:AfsR/SARP family transcriptional regulator n=1 Tax=Sphaerisporangium sp. TRM90804 TaxID=3031113 RepID=UPI002447ED90|nr:AfsR/SARP family transcriptional regulator [Sphaerisporangium sp. TRM90804]MDH2428361.1 AfsR/SARP family transcriptional regulator [Sphaerisporangium sp. TRM90804]